MTGACGASPPAESWAESPRGRRPVATRVDNILKTAKVLGLIFPQTILIRADHLIQ